MSGQEPDRPEFVLGLFREGTHFHVRTGLYEGPEDLSRYPFMRGPDGELVEVKWEPVRCPMCPRQAQIRSEEVPSTALRVDGVVSAVCPSCRTRLGR